MIRRLEKIIKIFFRELKTVIYWQRIVLSTRNG